MVCVNLEWWTYKSRGILSLDVGTNIIANKNINTSKIKKNKKISVIHHEDSDLIISSTMDYLFDISRQDDTNLLLVVQNGTNPLVVCMAA